MQLNSFFKLNSNHKKHRILIIISFLFFIYLIFIFKILNISIQNKDFKKNSFKSLNNFRRDIIDRNGKLLATNIPVASIALRPNQIINKDFALNAILEIFPEMSYKKIKNYINSDKNFIWLKRGVDPEIAKKLHDKGVQGIALEIEHRRLYIYSNLLSHIIGYTDIDNNGLAGVEQYYNDYLINLTKKHNIDQENIIDSNNNISLDTLDTKANSQILDSNKDQVNSNTKPNNYNNANLKESNSLHANFTKNTNAISASLAKNTNTSILADKDDEINNSDSLQLSIDVDIQNIVSEELENAMNEFNAIKGTCIILDPNTGEVLAIVNKPDFDPHLILNQESLFPTGWYGLYEVGSVFKTILFATSLDSRSAKLNDVYDIKKINIGKFTVKDYHYHEKKQSLPEIFMHSSNIGLVMLTTDIDQGIIRQYFKKLGLFDQLKIELPEKITPQYPKKHWETITLTTISYGYGISITPLHFAQSIVPIVNGGTFYDATIIKGKNKNKGIKVIDADISFNMNKLLRLVVTHGNAKKADVPGLVIGGKTGTAHKIKNKKYNDKTRVSSFIAVSPANKPKYLIYLLLDEPKGNAKTSGFATGSWSCAPVVAKILSRIAIIKGEKPQDESVNDEMFLEYKVD